MAAVKCIHVHVHVHHSHLLSLNMVKFHVYFEHFQLYMCTCTVSTYMYLYMYNVETDISLPREEMVLLRQVLTSPFFKSVKEVNLCMFVGVYICIVHVG